MLFNKSLMLAVLGAATGIKAQYGVRIFADNGMSYTSDTTGIVVESGGYAFALFSDDPTMDSVPITVSNGAHVSLVSPSCLTSSRRHRSCCSATSRESGPVPNSQTFISRGVIRT